MPEELDKQYDNFAEKFSHLANGEGDYSNTNKFSEETFLSHIDFLKPGLKVLDLACGDGTDIANYKSYGAEVYGVDASEEMLKIVKEKLPEVEVKFGLFENIPYEDNFFDVVFSKYAFQTSKEIDPIFLETNRILKKGGILMFLVVHPFRQYFERKQIDGNYFEQIIVDSHVFQNQITFREPTHTMNEYFSKYFLNSFDLEIFQEYWEPCAEQIDGKKYPGFFIIKAKKR